MSNLSNCPQNPTLISSELKTVACESAIVSANELANDKDLPLEEILNDQKEDQATQKSN